MPDDYPFFMKINVPRNASGITLSIGGKIGSDRGVDLPPGYLICLDSHNKKYLLAFQGGKEYVPQENCKWYWSTTYTANTHYDLVSYSLFRSMEYIGYIVTVPFDIVTSPLQILAFYKFANAFHVK